MIVAVDELEFRPDLYAGVAEHYERYRSPYPSDLLDDLMHRTGVDGDGRLLDLACGTGQIAFALREHFSEVWAVDQEEDMVAFGRRKAARLGIANIRWIAQKGEDLDPGACRFDLVAIGNAFHRLRRRQVAARVREWLAPGRFLALLWSSSPWSGDTEWQVATSAAIAEWTEALDATDRVPSGYDRAMADEPHSVVLAETGFEMLGEFEFPTPLRWTPETIAGFASSTSVLSPSVLGDRSAEFVADLRERLLRIEPSGVFHQTNVFAYQLARSPR
jgi:SAM-dependent methyltransferase